MDAFDPLTPEIVVGNVTVVQSEALLPSDVAAPSGIPEKVWVCCRGFSEADWNAAYAAWCNAVQYNEESDADFDPAVHIKNQKQSENVNGFLGEVDELDLFEIEPDNIPNHISNLFAKFCPGGKRKRRDLTFRQKLALLKWMDHAYPNEKYNFSQISKLTSLDRKTIRQMVHDRQFIESKVNELKHSGSTKKFGGFATKKRFRVSAAQFPAVDERLNDFFDEKSSNNLPLSRKILSKQAKRIAQDLGLENFKASSGYVDKFIKRNAIVPRSVTGSGQLIPHDAYAQAMGFITDLGETQRALNIQPRQGRNGMMDETPMWWSMARKKTLAKVGTKIIPMKSSGHDRKRYSVILAGFDNNEKALPGVIFKGLKKVPAEVRDRKDCFVGVAPGGSMTPDVLKLWLRKMWAKRPTTHFFRSPNILGWDMHYSHLDEDVVDTLKTVSNTTCKYVPGGMTCIMAGPDTHWNKPFKANMHEQMDEYMDNEEYLITDSGKIQPAPYSKICDWVVKAWNAIPAETIGNAFVHNGWEQAFNGHDTSVLHSSLRDIVDNNIVRGYQRRASPQQAEAHNEIVRSVREHLFGEDVESSDDFSDQDDFDFYKL